MSLFARGVCVTVFALVAASAALHADPLPAAYGTQVFIGNVLYSGFPVDYGATVSNSADYISPFSDGSVGYAAVTHGTTDPSVSSRLTASGTFGGSSLKKFDAETSVGYYFEVNGPANQSVTVNLASNGLAIAPTNFGSEAIFSILPVGQGSIFTALACAGDTSNLANTLCASTPNSPSSFNVNTSLSIQTDTAYLVKLWTETYFSAPSSPFPGEQDAWATIDPAITLATSDPNYSLSFSPGLAPDETPVPEPGTLALMLTGLAAFGQFYLRHRRSQIRTSISI